LLFIHTIGVFSIAYRPVLNIEKIGNILTIEVGYILAGTNQNASSDSTKLSG